jgi:hypothetical protein
LKALMQGNSGRAAESRALCVLAFNVMYGVAFPKGGVDVLLFKIDSLRGWFHGSCGQTVVDDFLFR